MRKQAMEERRHLAGSKVVYPLLDQHIQADAFVCFISNLQSLTVAAGKKHTVGEKKDTAVSKMEWLCVHAYGLHT